MINTLKERVQQHEGEFLCEAIGSEADTKVVKFTHLIEEPVDNVKVPQVGDIPDFYAAFGSLALFFCPESDEAAFYIARPDEWPALEEDFSGWVDLTDEDDQELLPAWFGDHFVVGEIPSSGNYLLIVTSGNETGSVYEFEHDGFEFIKLAASLDEFILKSLSPDVADFSAMASHLRFISNDYDQQWWAIELRTNDGKVLKNED
ncbi:MAG: hypothetical protein ACI82Q_002760 [Nonlabens sp.]|jgi:hypothetical protein